MRPDRQLDRKVPPPFRNAFINPHCLNLWWRGRIPGRAFSFVGLTVIDSCEFFLAPCFGYLRGHGPIQYYVNTTIGASIGDELPALDVDRIFGADNIIRIPLTEESYRIRSTDGYAHQGLIRWINALRLYSGGMLRDSDVIGWGLLVEGNVPNKHIIKFVSGRNMFKFAARREERSELYSDHEARDLPKRWAEWVELVLKYHLRLLSLEGKYQRDIRTLSPGKIVSSKMRVVRPVPLPSARRQPREAEGFTCESCLRVYNYSESIFSRRYQCSSCKKSYCDFCVEPSTPQRCKDLACRGRIIVLPRFRAAL